MKEYPVIPENHLWTLTDSPDSETGVITVSDKDSTFHLMTVQYPEVVYNNIIKQAESYKIIEKSVTGRSSETENRCDESKIKPECIVVKDNCFVGIFTLCTHREEVHLHTVKWEEHQGILFADGTSAGVNYDEFEGNPGCFRYTCSYSLEKC